MSDLDIVRQVAEVLYEHRGDREMPHRYPVGPIGPGPLWRCLECDYVVDDAGPRPPPCPSDWRKPLHFQRYMSQAYALADAGLLAEQPS